VPVRASVEEQPVPLAISITVLVLFTTLLLLGKIGEASFSFLTAGTALLGLVLHGFGRLQELDLKNLRVVLREIEETKKELFVREEKLKKIALPLAQIIALTGASEGRMGSRESWSAKREWYRRKVQELIAALELSAKESAEIQKYADKYAEIDRALGEREGLTTTDPDHKEVKAKLEALSTEILEMMKADTEQ
jgi:hypothetical protein